MLPTPQPERKPPSLFRAVRGRLGAIVTLSLVGAVASTVPLMGLVEVIRALWPALSGEPVDPARVWGAVGLCMAGLVAGFLTTSSATLLSHLADADVQLDVRTRIVAQLRALPLGWFDARSSGAVRKVAENDVSAIHQLVAHAIQDVITAIAVPTIAVAYLLTVDWSMACACLIPLVITAVLYPIMMRGGKEKYAQYDASVVRLNAATIEYVHGISVVKSFGEAGRSHQRYREETGRFVQFYGGWARETSTLMSAIEIVASPVVALAVVCVAGTWLVTSAAMPAQNVVPALVLGLGLTQPLLSLGLTALFLRTAAKARTSLQEFFRQAPTAQAADPVEPRDGSVDLTEVSFAYDDGRDVLRDIAASCTPGTVTALVGPSGSGKSTLARLVPRFYDATGGTVRVGGADVTQLAAARLYAQVGFVFQDAHLLRTSVRDNIRLTRPDASQQDVERAARAAHIHLRITRLPRGYDSVVGQDAHLSGGEAQRLTIARALLTDAPILVLDEATAFADPDSEAAIQSALSALARQRTLLVIAHRLHTITGADQILVLDGGRIVERGTHHALVAAGGRYAGMWERYEAARTREMAEVAR